MLGQHLQFGINVNVVYLDSSYDTCDTRVFVDIPLTNLVWK